MGTSTATPSKEIIRQKSVTDLDTFESVTLKKRGNFTPVTSTQEALSRLGNNAEKFLQVINDGLEQEYGSSLINDPNSPWLVEDEEGNFTEFSGTPADDAKVNALVLNLAKTTFMEGDWKNSSLEQKRAARKAAVEFIKGNEVIVAKLRDNAAR
jgi:hypothetical protein